MMKKIRFLAWLGALTLLVMAVGCAGAEAPAEEEQVAQTWEQRNISFAPTTLEVDVGDKVKIVNADSIPHTFTVQNPETGEVVMDQRLNGGDSVVFTFDTGGVWKVWCTLHSDGTSSEPATSGMKAKVGAGVAVPKDGDAGGSSVPY